MTFYFIFTTCPLYVVLTLYGEILSWSLVGVGWVAEGKALFTLAI